CVVSVMMSTDFANALKPAVLPGERLDVLLIKEGKESNQGVGYLDDGTMVVVERARERIGETLPVQGTSVLQQPSGKIIFTKIAAENDSPWPICSPVERTSAETVRGAGWAVTGPRRSWASATR